MLPLSPTVRAPGATTKANRLVVSLPKRFHEVKEDLRFQSNKESSFGLFTDILYSIYGGIIRENKYRKFRRWVKCKHPAG